jgi:hypothetical protein
MTDEPGYKVGYGKPPLDGQFKDGISGNPSGRPKGARSLKADLLDELTQIVRVTENGKAQKLTKQQLVVKALVAKAARGDNGASGRLFPLIQDALGFGDDTSDANTPLSNSDKAILAAFLAGAGPPSTDDDDE